MSCVLFGGKYVNKMIDLALTSIESKRQDLIDENKINQDKVLTNIVLNKS